MDDDDFRALVALVQAELRASGAADVANEAHYVIRSSDAEDDRMLPPEKHLVEMLEAFGRMMAVRDRATYNDALKRIRNSVTNEGPVGAFVTRAPEDTERVDVDLSLSPDLSEVRGDLRHLIGQLRERGAEPQATR